MNVTDGVHPRFSREAALKAIRAGDIFHGTSSSGASLVCLTLDVTDHSIISRTVTTHITCTFDRTTGLGRFGRAKAEIDSVGKLPSDVHEVMLGIDKKYGPPYIEGADMRLTLAEREGLKFISRFYMDNPLP